MRKKRARGMRRKADRVEDRRTEEKERRDHEAKMETKISVVK